MDPIRPRNKRERSLLPSSSLPSSEFYGVSIAACDTVFGGIRLSCAKMESQKPSTTTAAPPTPIASCRKKKDDANFLEDLKDHIDEFMSASMDEHKSCFKKTVQKMFGMSKIVAERNSTAQEVESSLPLRTTVSE